MILKHLLAVNILCVYCNIVAVYAHDCDDGPTSQLTLCQEFQLIRDLAPEESIVRLVESHMENDIRFRKAVQYILSDDFKKTTAKIDATATFKSLLRQLVRKGVDTTDINSVGKIFDCVLIPILEEATSESRSSFHNEHNIEKRSLNTFVQEIGRLIPTNELVDTLKTQIKENKQFATFYKAVREPSFRTNVMEGFINRDVSRSIKTLRRFQIDLSKMVEYAFNLLYLGPDV